MDRGEGVEKCTQLQVVLKMFLTALHTEQSHENSVCTFVLFPDQQWSNGSSQEKKIPLRDLQDGKASDHQMKVKISWALSRDDEIGKESF